MASQKSDMACSDDEKNDIVSLPVPPLAILESDSSATFCRTPELPAGVELLNGGSSFRFFETLLYNPHRIPLNLTPKGTVNLLPKIEQQDQNSGEPRSEKEIGQMTIFYGGQVIVLNEIPTEKAKEIMTLATNYSAAVSPIQKPAESTAVSTTSGPHALQLPLLSSDLPIARKNSLARFLEKRKDRTAGTECV